MLIDKINILEDEKIELIKNLQKKVQDMPVSKEEAEQTVEKMKKRKRKGL